MPKFIVYTKDPAQLENFEATLDDDGIPCVTRCEGNYVLGTVYDAPTAELRAEAVEVARGCDLKAERA